MDLGKENVISLPVPLFQRKNMERSISNRPKRVHKVPARKTEDPGGTAWGKTS